jgi:lysylphosphatidylglycerol synthetase-like protein (DUF2156 family)
LNITSADTSSFPSVIYLALNASLPVNLASITSVSSLPQVFLDIVALAAHRIRSYRESLVIVQSVASSNSDRQQASRLFAGIIWAHIMLASVMMAYLSAVLQAWRKPGIESHPVMFWFVLFLAVLGGVAVGGGVTGWVCIVFVYLIHAVLISIQYCCRVHLCCPSCLRRCACCCCITVEGGAVPGIGRSFVCLFFHALADKQTHSSV